MTDPATVLIIHREPAVRRMVALAVELASWQPLVAASAEAGEAICRDQRVDAVVCALELPGMSGREFARALAALPGRTPPVILTSIQERRGLAGEQPLLAEPLSLDDLVERLEAILPPRPKRPAHPRRALRPGHV